MIAANDRSWRLDLSSATATTAERAKATEEQHFSRTIVLSEPSCLEIFETPGPMPWGQTAGANVQSPARVSAPLW